MLEQVKATIRYHDLLHRGDRVLVGLSGGPDSVALLYALTTLRADLRLELHAVHVNHGIRKEAGPTEERFCEQFCDRLQVPLVIERADIPKVARSEGKGIEEAARDYRYRVFERVANQLNCNRIALGHHADDQTETILFRVLRGTGRTGLGGIPIKRDRYIRPLLEVEKATILKYLSRHELVFCTDESNSDLSYSRNYLRHHLLAEIRKNVNPAVDQALRNLAESLEEEERFLEEIVDEAIRKSASLTAGGKLVLDLNRLGRYAVGTRRRTLRRCLMAISGVSQAPDRIAIARLGRLCERARGSMSLPGRVHAVCSDARLYMYQQKIPRISLVLESDAGVKIPGLFVEVRRTGPRKAPKKIRRAPRAKTVLIDADKVAGELVVRTVRPGDRFRPLGMRGTKKVGDYLTDRKIPVAVRDEVLVVCDGRGIIWLVGLEISETVKLNSRTRKVIRLAYRELKTDRGDALRTLTGSAEDR